MSRLHRLLPADLDDQQREVYTAIAHGSRRTGRQLFEIVDGNGALHGPFNAMLVQPELGMAIQRVGEILRYRTSLSAEVREAVILRAAAAWHSEFEWYAHVPVARAAGLPESVIAAIRAGREPKEAAPDVRIGVEVASLVLNRADVPDNLYAEATDAFGAAGMVELVGLIGYYGLLAGLLQVFEVALPDGAPRVWTVPTAQPDPGT